jgi:predicted nucleotidyltransferase
MKVENLIVKYPVYLVGSVLKKDNPRDIDILCVIPDDDFEKIFNLKPNQWKEEGKTGNWSNERYRWGSKCIAIAGILAKRLNSNVDFKFIPERFFIENKDRKKN